MAAIVTNPFQPRAASGSSWNATVEKPDQLLAGGNTLSGNVSKAQTAAEAVNAATDAVASTTGTSEPAPVTPPDYGSYGGRPGETPGNMFTPQYSAAGTPLAGSIAAAISAATTAGPAQAAPAGTPADASQYWLNLEQSNPASFYSTLQGSHGMAQLPNLPALGYTPPGPAGATLAAEQAFLSQVRP